MGATQSIPVVVEVLTITDSGQQGMAGGACELVKDINNFPDQYDIETANKHYTEVKLIQASSRVVFSEAESNTETTAYLLDKGKESWTELDDMCIPPSTGEEEHVIGLIRYGERGPQGGSRMTVAPPLIAGRAVKVAANGLATDSSTANTSSLDRENLTPTSTIAEVVQGWETGQANEWVSAVEIPIGVPVAGALEEAARSRFLARDPLTALSHPVSFLDHYRPHTEVNDGIEQVSFDDLKSRRETAGFIKEFPSSEYALAQMLRGHT